MMRWLLAPAVLAFVPTASADDLPWNRCAAEASTTNPSLQASRANLRAAESRLTASFSGFFPQVSGSLGYSRQDFVNNASTGGAENVYSVGVTGSENLFSGFQDRAKVEQTLAEVDLARANLDLSRATASYDLKSAFSSLWFAQNSVKLTEDIARRREENLRLVELRFEGGMENKGSFFLSRAFLSQARFEVVQARNAIESGRQQLAQVLGRNSAGGLSVTGDPPIQAVTPAADFEALIPVIPEHRRSLAQEKAGRAAVTGARSPFYPSLDLAGSYSRQGTDWFPADGRWSVGLALTVPLFNGGRDWFGTRAALESLSAAVSNRGAVDQGLRTRLRQTYNGYTESVEKLKVDEEFRDAASVRAEIARNKYNNGLLSFENWDIIENDLIARQKAVLQSRRDRAIAEAAWDQAQGKGVIP